MKQRDGHGGPTPLQAIFGRGEVAVGVSSGEFDGKKVYAMTLQILAEAQEIGTDVRGKTKGGPVHYLVFTDAKGTEPVMRALEFIRTRMSEGT